MWHNILEPQKAKQDGLLEHNWPTEFSTMIEIFYICVSWALNNVARMNKEFNFAFLKKFQSVKLHWSHAVSCDGQGWPNSERSYARLSPRLWHEKLS